jgi:ornithine carbamoyltransferase
MRHVLTIADIPAIDIHDIIRIAKQRNGAYPPLLAGKSVGMIFEKPSNRTRLSFEVGIHRMGGQAVYIQGSDVQIGDREPVSHVSRVMSRYFDAIVYRTTSHSRLKEFAQYSAIPVINGLSNVAHPCQAIADALTIYDCFDGFESVYMVYIGDGNNVCRSLMAIATACGFKMAVVCPKAYQPEWVPPGVVVTDTIDSVIHNATVLYTDVWTSMGSEDEQGDRARVFSSYQVNESVMRSAQKGAIFLHCLPANMGQEVTEAVFESPASKVFDQAENRMHAQNAILEWVMKG